MEHQGSRFFGNKYSSIYCQRRLSQRPLRGAIRYNTGTLVRTESRLFSSFSHAALTKNLPFRLQRLPSRNKLQQEVIAHHSPIHQHATEKPFEPFWGLY